MKNNIQILMMMVAAVCSAQSSSSVEQIMNDLQAATPAETSGSAPEVVSGQPSTVYQAEHVAQITLEAHSGLPAKETVNPVSAYLLDRQLAKEKQDAEEVALDRVTVAWNGMILRDYQLSPAALEKMKLKDVDRSTDVREQFPDIDFPEGSKAVYRPVLNRLYVLNTPENTARLEAVLTALEAPQNTDKGQIEIKTRFVEFSEGALEELGFNWSELQDGNATKLAGDWSVKDGETLFSDALRTGSEVFTQPENIGGAGSEDRAFGDWTSGRLTDQFSEDAGSLKITGDLGPKVEMLIRALDQTSGTDVLSAPSVVTRAGQKASIQVGQVHYFPENFKVGGNEGTIVHVSYQGFSEKLLGVDLNVNPMMVKDDLIEMELNPKVTELLGWRNYQIAPANSAYTYYQFRIGNTYEHDPVIARLPIFRHREVKTKVTIQDGSTIGMGGLITEKNESFSDRVPVMGSIPLVGRLFRSEGTRSVKRNLMIFVTASKVAPNGRMISESVVK